MTKLLEYNQVNPDKWELLLQNSDTASFFQTKDCYEFYCKLQFIETFLYGIETNDVLECLVCGYIIAEKNKLTRFFSRRAIIPGGVLISRDCSNEALNTLLSTINKKLKSKSIYIETRNFNDYSNYKSIFELNGFYYNPHLNIQVKTNNKPLLLSKINRNKIKHARLSKQNGAVCELSKNIEDISKLYQILCNLYKTRVKTPIFPLEFFIELSKKEFSKIFIVKKEHEVIGGIVTVNYHKNTMYEWFICGIDNKTAGIYPSTLATMTAIEYATDNGFQLFDFMGAGKPNQKYGVKDFKAKFGGEIVETGRFLKINNHFLYQLGKMAISIIKR